MTAIGLAPEAASFETGLPQSEPMRADQVALTPECVECGAVWLPADDERWRLYIVDDELAFYCRECAKREFDEP